jgi:hypothetical protein
VLLDHTTINNRLTQQSCFGAQGRRHPLDLDFAGSVQVDDDVLLGTILLTPITVDVVVESYGAILGDAMVSHLHVARLRQTCLECCNRVHGFDRNRCEK